jgi:hypothetical protein
MNNTILTAYLTCALWSSTGDDDEPLDQTNGIEDIDLYTRLKMERDVQQAVTLADAFVPNWRSYWDDEQFGHDFWLTRNGHGAGFWDRAPTRNPEHDAIGEALTTIARSFSEVDLYVGDDGRVYAV